MCTAVYMITTERGQCYEEAYCSGRSLQESASNLRVGNDRIAESNPPGKRLSYTYAMHELRSNVKYNSVTRSIARNVSTWVSRE